MGPIARVRGVFGGSDILVNNAGITGDRTFQGLDEGRRGGVLDADLPTALASTLTAMAPIRESAERETAGQGTAACIERPPAGSVGPCR